MPKSTWVGFGVAFVAPLLACGSTGNGSRFDGGTGSTGDATVDGTSSGGGGDGAPSFGDGAGDDGGGNGCTPPQMLIVLDHTDSMSDTPNGAEPANTDAGHAKTKWVLATEAIDALVAPPADQKLAFGLELFPLDPQTVTDAGATGQCKTLSQLLAGQNSSNTSCDPAEVPIGPAVGTGNAITTLLDPETLRLCVSTPIAKALATAQAELASVVQPNVPQYVLLVTDGGETCKGDVVGAAQALAAAGVKTFVVGFGSLDAGAAGVDTGLLDQVACAGETAIGFPGACEKTDAGYTAASTTGSPIFYLAEDGTSLQTALQLITSKLCCGCAQ